MATVVPAWAENLRRVVQCWKTQCDYVERVCDCLEERAGRYTEQCRFASCYAVNSMRPLRLFRGSGGYLSLLAHQCPRGAPRTRVVYHGPRMTLRQICRMLQMMRQVGGREAAAGVTRKQESTLPCPSPQVSMATDRLCFPGCPRRRRSSNMKRMG